MRFWITLLALIGLFGVNACNTTEGAGQDIENTGEAISDTADDVEDEL